MGSIKKGEKTVVILRYLGPKGGPGASKTLNHHDTLNITFIRRPRDAGDVEADKFDHGCWSRF